MTYKPDVFDWGGFDSFFSFGKDANGNYKWSRINVLPANNVYFEENFSGVDVVGGSQDGSPAGGECPVRHRFGLS